MSLKGGALITDGSTTDQDTISFDTDFGLFAGPGLSVICHPEPQKVVFRGRPLQDPGR